jgi:hypothetical protein
MTWQQLRQESFLAGNGDQAGRSGGWPCRRFE